MISTIPKSEVDVVCSLDSGWSLTCIPSKSLSDYGARLARGSNVARVTPNERRFQSQLS